MYEPAPEQALPSHVQPLLESMQWLYMVTIWHGVGEDVPRQSAVSAPSHVQPSRTQWNWVEYAEQVAAVKWPVPLHEEPSHVQPVAACSHAC